MIRSFYGLALTVVSLTLSCESYDVRAVPSPDGIIGFEGDDYANAIQKTSDGGYILAGYTNSTRKNYEMFIVKTRSDLATEWSKSLGGDGPDRANSVVESPDKGYVVVGTMLMGPGDFDAYAIRLDQNGNQIWAHNFGGGAYEEGRTVLALPHDEYLIVGTTNSLGAGSNDVLLIRINADGDTLWQRTWGTPNDERAQGATLLRDGNFVITGYMRMTTTAAFLIKFTPEGSLIWTQTYPGCNRNEGFSVVEAADDDLVMAGRSSIICPPYFDYDAYFVRTDPLGNPRWAKTYGRTRYDEMYSLQPAADLGFIAVGRAYRVSAKFVPNHQMYVVRLDRYGDSLWTRLVGDAAPDEGDAIVADGNGGFVVAGYTQNFGAKKSDILLIRFDDDGNYHVGN